MGDGGFVSRRRKRRARQPQLVPGGSSGGSAAAVSALLCAGATATDTGGSIRQPAAFTGTVGIKPTYGRCSRWGIVAFASSLDQAGPIARDVRDAAIMLKSMASVDPKDTTSVDRRCRTTRRRSARSIKGMKIGIPKEYRVDGMPDEIEALWQQGIAWLKDAGAEIVDISLPHTKYALPAYYIVAPAEASSNLARYDGVRYGLRVPGKDIVDMYEKTRAAGFGREVKRRIMIGTYVLSAGYYDAYYLQAQKVRTLIKRDFETVFDDGVDVILTPATPSAAFGVADEDMAADPVKMYLNDIFTVTVNMAGLPGIAVPAGLDAQGPAARPAADRQAVRRGDAVPDGASHRAGGRPVRAGEVVVGIMPHDAREIANIVQALLDQPITIHGDGSQTRSFCYVDELIDGMMKLMATPDAVIGPINIGNTREFTILELAKMVIEITGSRSEIVRKPLPGDDPKQRQPDITKARALLGWEPKVPAREGLARTVAYFRELLAEEIKETVPG